MTFKKVVKEEGEAIMKCFVCTQDGFKGNSPLAEHIMTFHRDNKGAYKWADKYLTKNPITVDPEKPRAPSVLESRHTTISTKDFIDNLTGGEQSCEVLGVDIGKQFPFAAKEINRLRQKEKE